MDSYLLLQISFVLHLTLHSLLSHQLIQLSVFELLDTSYLPFTIFDQLFFVCIADLIYFAFLFNLTDERYNRDKSAISFIDR